MVEQRLIKAIDADDFLRELREKKKKACYQGCEPESWESAFLEFEALTERTPTVDAVPVRYGKWIKTVEIFGFDDFEEEAYSCSACNVCQKPYFVFRSKYCPNCGAKMEGGAPCE